ncbi:MAG: ZIP family metal transporter [Candidatus Aenigmatarchaeota archaeon]|nr:MAG: ZIP family metal transporter [Candidatus Aenigmarchaeota archaeon]
MIPALYLPWVYALLSVFFISLLSLVGLASFLVGKKRMTAMLLFLISFAAGSLFGGAFLHLLPEALEEIGDAGAVGFYMLFGLMIFFVLEKFVQWRHCHLPTTSDHPHPFAYMNLVGDALHNFIDGLMIGVAYIVSIPLGIATTLAVIFHEIPQEIGDFGVLIHGGFKKKKAVLLNFLTALLAVIGAMVGLALGSSVESFALIVIPITAGGFIYIAGSDLIPEMHKECSARRSTLQLIGIMLGIFVMYLLLFME